MMPDIKRSFQIISEHFANPAKRELPRGIRSIRSIRFWSLHVLFELCPDPIMVNEYTL